MMLNDYQKQLDDKTTRLSSMLSCFDAPEISVFSSPDKHYRMRAEFRVWHDDDDLYHIMFDPITKKPYRVNQFEPASRVINKAMRALEQYLKPNWVLRQKLFQIDYLTGLSESLIISLLYHRQLDDEWRAEAEKLQSLLKNEFDVSLIGRARKQKIPLDKDYIIEHLPIDGREYKFKHVENSFTQPNAYVNIKMIEWAMQCADELNGDLLEFYCGAGNFSLPLSSRFPFVVGTEIAKPSVEAAQYSIHANAINNVTIVRLAAEEFVAALAGERKFRRMENIDLSAFNFKTVLVDPPRAGLDEKTLNYVQDFENIIYISCNPDTLTDNLNTLINTHDIKAAAMFDQFPFTPHIESGVLLTKK